MLGAAHACANPLTARLGLVHGVAVGVMLPHVIRFNAASAATEYEELHRASGRGPTLEARVCELRRAAGLAERLRDCPVPEDCLGELAEEAAGQWTARFNPRPVGPGELLELYESAF